MTKRAAGVLLHPTSLPGAYGAGDLGPEAYRFVEWMAASGLSLWQVLPLTPVGLGFSPYMSSSSSAGNPLLIDLGELVELGFLSAEALEDASTSSGLNASPPSGRIDFERQTEFRMSVLRQAYNGFVARQAAPLLSEFQAFVLKNSGWLEDDALFFALSECHPGLAWNEWPAPLAFRDSGALQALAHAQSERLGFWRFVQWLFDRQWFRLKAYASQHGVRLVGDVPIFVAFHSVDVWAHPELFELDALGVQTVVAGVPPDYFSATGQRWGNPLYRWPAHEKTQFAWWVGRLRRALTLTDFVRIDHFRGFAACWEIPASEPLATAGSWRPAPGKALLSAVKEAFPAMPLIAEDLGIITDDVVALRTDFELPGMRILQFAFSEDAGHAYLPHRYSKETVAYTGTHDNNTLQGWWSEMSPRERSFVQLYLGTDGQALHWTAIRALSASVADWVVFPMQDILGLDASHRMNVPGVPDGNWGWRFDWAWVQPWHAQTLRAIGAVHGRTAFSGAHLPA